MSVTTIYFLRPVGGGPVKIGCSRWVERRLVDYQRWSPVPLEVVARIEADQKVERQFHALFFDLHSHHEWFHESPRISAVIDAINGGTFDLASLPRGRNLYSPADQTWTPERRAKLSRALREGHQRRKAAAERRRQLAAETAEPAQDAAA